MKRSGEKCKKSLAKKHACYVLITCGMPSSDGNMEVEMSYQGDAKLAAYLLQGAQLNIQMENQDLEPPYLAEKISFLTKNDC